MLIHVPPDKAVLAMGVHPNPIGQSLLPLQAALSSYPPAATHGRRCPFTAAGFESASQRHSRFSPMMDSGERSVDRTC